MSAFKLKSVLIRNFATIRDAFIEFPKSGLVLVRGKTNAEAGTNIESVGAGKTAFGEAIAKASLGVLTRSANISDYVHDEVNENLYVCVKGDLNGQEIVIEEGYKCPELSATGEGLRFAVGGQPPIERNRIANTRLELAKTLGVDPTLAAWTVFFDGEQKNFNNLSQTAAVDLLMLALNQPAWDAYHSKAKDHAKTFKDDLANTKTKITESESEVSRLERAAARAAAKVDDEQKAYDDALDTYDDQAEGHRRKISESERRLDGNSARLKEIKKEIKVLENEHADENKRLELLKMDLGNKKARAARFVESRNDKIDAAERRIRKLKRELKSAQEQPEKCPTCNQPWHQEVDTSDIEERLSKAEAESDRFADLHAKAVEDRKTYAAGIKEIETALGDLGTRDGITSLSDEVDDLERDSDEKERALKRARRALDDLKQPTNANLTAAKALLEREKEELARVKSRIEDLNAERVDIEESVRVVDYWVKAYSPSGIPNMVLRNAIAPLNSASQRLCAALTGGAIDVRYSTTAHLKSGDAKPKLKITVDNSIGAKNIKMSSKGEGGLSKLVVPETLAEVGQVARRIGFRWYDEVANHQDPSIRRNLFSHMQNVAEQLGILVFVVDHHPEVASFADHTLLVEKQAEKTSIVRWD